MNCPDCSSKNIYHGDIRILYSEDPPRPTGERWYYCYDCADWKCVDQNVTISDVNLENGRLHWIEEKNESVL